MPIVRVGAPLAAQSQSHFLAHPPRSRARLIFLTDGWMVDASSLKTKDGMWSLFVRRAFTTCNKRNRNTVDSASCYRPWTQQQPANFLVGSSGIAHRPHAAATERQSCKPSPSPTNPRHCDNECNPMRMRSLFWSGGPSSLPPVQRSAKNLLFSLILAGYFCWCSMANDITTWYQPPQRHPLAFAACEGNSNQEARGDSQRTKKGSQPFESTDKVQTIVRHLKHTGVKMVAIDFDQTLIDIHTEGMWWRDPESIAPFIRPQFRRLLRALTQNNISVAIVSFSSQADVIRAALYDIALNHDSSACFNAQSIPVQAFLPRTAMWKGKQLHLANLDVPLDDILLIDDSQMNIYIAQRHGVRAIWFDPENPDELWENLADL